MFRDLLIEENWKFGKACIAGLHTNKLCNKTFSKTLRIELKIPFYKQNASDKLIHKLLICSRQ